MRYSEIIDYPRVWNRAMFPVLAHIEIQAEDFAQLERRAADQTQVRILGHDEAADDRLVVHVACVDGDARRRFVRRWT